MPITIAELIAQALYFILPAYCANAIPVLFGGGLPIDFGRNFIDGKPLFGAHKTFRGFLSGLLVGTLVGFAQSNLLIFQPPHVLLGFVLSLGAVDRGFNSLFRKAQVGSSSRRILSSSRPIRFRCRCPFLLTFYFASFSTYCHNHTYCDATPTSFNQLHCISFKCEKGAFLSICFTICL